MQKKRSRAGRKLHAASALPLTVLSLGLGAPVIAQAQTQNVVLEEIIVSARRQEESSQDIPISITVVDQNTMSNNNVFSAIDLKQFTPSLSTNTRFGPDQASFAIRGFTQELRTTASVGFYFAEVVAPRGGGSVTAGDGAGPGAFFDLQNVLVLKGPQGTLFGRNTTGGAILLTPQEPTNELEGYLEGSAGDYDMRRLQGVINVPFSDTVRARFGVDTMQRDGYLDNNSGFGPKDLGDTDYVSFRASVMWDVTDTIENYTIVSYTDSENNGIVSSLFACNPNPTSPAGSPLLFKGGCDDQLLRQGDDFYGVQSRFEKPKSELKQWQIINKTSWAINDDLTLRNILSYSEMEQRNNTSVYGINYEAAFDGGFYAFTESNDVPGYPTNSQTSVVEELQLQGYAMDGDLTWQVGLYFENSRPDGKSGSQALNYLHCTSYDPSNPAAAECLAMDVAGAAGWAGISRQVSEVEFTSKAVYTEATYDLHEQWKITGGLRYTNDETEGTAESTVWSGFPLGLNPVAVPGNPTVVADCVYSTADPSNCRDSLEQSSEAVTGLIGVDYFPTQDVMLYAKYARGYRQGSISLFSGDGLRTFDPEQVDAYEIGAKTKFGGPVPGTLNVALFYNDLQDQQLQYGYLAPGAAPTQAIVNAGKSVIQGVEVEASFRLLEDLALNLSYTYLDTELKDAIDIPSVPGQYDIINTATPGSDLTFAPKHSVVVGLNYLLPLPVEVGDVSLGATYSYTGEQFSTGADASPYALLDSYEVVNLNANWKAIFGSNFDAGLFVTNAFDEEYTTYVSGLYNSMGFETRMTGVPRMWGAKVRYNFGL